MMSDPIVKPEGDKYETTDKNMCMCLMMRGFHLGEGLMTVLPDSDNQLIYTFDLETVWPTVLDVLMGKDLTFTYDNYWKADAVWQMNLRHYSRIRNRRVSSKSSRN